MQLLDSERAPARPESQDHELPTISAQPDIRSVEAGKGKIRGRPAYGNHIRGGILLRHVKGYFGKKIRGRNHNESKSRNHHDDTQHHLNDLPANMRRQEHSRLSPDGRQIDDISWTILAGS